MTALGKAAMGRARMQLRAGAAHMARLPRAAERRERHRQNYMHVTIHTAQVWGPPSSLQASASQGRVLQALGAAILSGGT